ncbi:lymphatic vessel endothelial hyaluronic receptor 1b isoform X1 [Tachysurus vachellii]|uniref:lymphatic vessel endothelial hyaluronic receptor 1b isoform X1 n=1 Tax=Tachysurus vachellii TaxID=175792 RepID=UPI00296B3179|nr:lymphatic vessel endothelial hyaluronic receptor 1b isoform X1 [Tachysurus vachellii]
MRSRVCLVLLTFLPLVLCTASLDLRQIQVYPKDGISDVFIVQLKSQKYTFNATTAIDVCTSLGVSIATRAQVEAAQHNGLQTCRYGWVKEKVAVIPRTEKNPKCGQSKVGVIVWVASFDQLFDVFCFNSKGQTEATTFTTPNMTSVSDGRTQAKPTSPPFFLSTQPTKNLLGFSPSPQSISTAFSTSVIPTVFSSTVIPMTTLIYQTSPSDISLTSTSQGYRSSNFSPFSTSFSSTDLSSHPFTNSPSVNISSNKTDGQQPLRKGFSFGAVSIALSSIFVMLLIIAVTGTVWYFKMKGPQRRSPWERICHNDMFETEMWKHTEQQDFDIHNDSGNCGDDITLQLEDDTISS